MAKRRRHKGCKTCTCFRPKQARHVCSVCKTRKLEKYMERTGTRGAFGKPQWRCLGSSSPPFEGCKPNENYR